MKILIATHNPGKLEELQKGLLTLKNKDFEIISLKDLSIDKKPKETGKTFKENSLLKATFYANLSGCPTVADDGGLIIPSLNNEPGVKSRRWKGYDATDEELIQYTLSNLTGSKGTDRMAYLQTCITFYDPKTRTSISETEKIDGYIADVASNKRIVGYPFRALFIVYPVTPGLHPEHSGYGVKKFNQPRSTPIQSESNRGKYYDELTEKEHEEINHRLKAAKRLAKKIQSYLLQ